MAPFTPETSSFLRRVLLLEQYAEQTDSRLQTVPLPWTTVLIGRNYATLFVILCGLLSAIPIGIYYLIIYNHAYNFPYEDDFNSALLFVTDFVVGGLGLWGKLKLIFSQYNEHRIVFDRLVFLADYWLAGNLNFRHLILIGNLSLLLVCFLFSKVAFRALPLQHKLLYLLPVSYSLFSFQYWELSTWSMAALQNLYVVPFAFLSLYSLTKPGQKAFLVAYGAAILATYTSGNGLFSFVAGIPVLLLLKAYRRLAVWLFVSVLTIGFYFLSYIKPPYHPDIVDSLVNHTSRAVTYFFLLTGSLASSSRPKTSLLLGATLLLFSLGLVVYLWYTKRLTAHLTLLSWLLFLYLTCLSLVASRSGLGEEQAFTPRYGIVMVMLFATLAVLSIEAAPNGWLRLGVWGGYTSVALFVYLSPINQINQQRLIDRTQHLRYSTAFFNENPAHLFLHWGNSDVAESIFREAHKDGIFKVPALTFRDLKSIPTPFDATRLVASSSTITHEVKPYNTPDFLVLYRSWVLINNDLPRNTIIQVVAQSANASYVFDTYKQAWNDVADHTLGRLYTQPGFSCVLDKRDLKPGHYTLWLRLTNGSKTAYQKLNVEFLNDLTTPISSL